MKWGREWPKFNSVKQGKYFLWTVTYNSLAENEEYDILSYILETILDCMPRLILDLNMFGFQYICRVM